LTSASPKYPESAEEETIRLLNDEAARLRDQVSEGDERERSLKVAVQAAEARTAERGVLLSEVNHRAKNSIQMAMSLLNLQRQASTDPHVRDALAGAVERLGHVARVHSMLYGHAPDEQTVDFAGYLESLCAETMDALSGDNVQISVDTDGLILDTARAINLALITGEAITNALKHAFPGGRPGLVRVECRRDGHGVTLSISDNGVGLRKEARSGALGMRLIRTLSAAVGGIASIDDEQGTRVAIKFPM
jgi:two-component sensor histidine kinase